MKKIKINQKYYNQKKLFVNLIKLNSKKIKELNNQKNNTMKSFTIETMFYKDSKHKKKIIEFKLKNITKN